MNLKLLALSAASAAMLVSAGPGTVANAAPKIPCKTAKLIVPWAAGGGTHVLFSIYEKTISEMGLTPKLKVVTVPGQGGNKGAKEAAKAKPDGCTLFAIHQSAFTSHLNGRIDFHFDAFDPVAQLTDTPDIIGAAGNAPWNTFDEFMAGVKAAPAPPPERRPGKSVDIAEVRVDVTVTLRDLEHRVGNLTIGVRREQPFDDQVILPDAQ